jgi:hypothetical protein
MLKKIALCAMLVLILIPASVMAAGQSGQAQQKTSDDTTARLQTQVRSMQESGSALQDGERQTVRNRSCIQDCDMVQNMTQNQIRLGYASAVSGDSPGTAFCNGNGAGNCTAMQQQGGQADRLQYKSSSQQRAQSGLTTAEGQSTLDSSAEQSGDRFRTMVRSMIKNQTKLQDGSCTNC